MSHSSCPHCGWKNAPALGPTVEPLHCPRCQRALNPAAPSETASSTEIPWYLQASEETNLPTDHAAPAPLPPVSEEVSWPWPTDSRTTAGLPVPGEAKPRPEVAKREEALGRLSGPQRATRALDQRPPSEPLPLEELPPDDAPNPFDPPRPVPAARRSDQPAPKAERSELEGDAEAQPRSGGGKKVALVGAVLFSVVAVAVGIGFVVRGTKKDVPPPDGPTQVERPPVGPAPGPVTPPELHAFKPEEIAERLISSTVLVTPDKDINSLGSGILVHREPHVVLTNWHVVSEARNKSVLVFFPDRDAKNQVISQVAHYQNKAEILGIPAKIIHADRGRDIAMLELSRVPDSAVPVSLAPGSAKQLERVYGNGQSGAAFSALWQSNEGSCRQLVDLPFAEGSAGTSRVLLTSQPVNPGDSGGPVVNSQLELVGIVKAKASKYLKVLEKTVKVEGLDNFSLVVDVEELRSHLNDGFRFAYKRSFPEPSNQFARGAGGKAGAAPPKAKPRTPEELIQVLSFGASDLAPQAIRELREAGTAAVPLLINMLRNDEQRGNWPKALQALERIDNPAASAPAVEVAIRCLKDDDAKTKIETKIAAAKFLRAVNPYGKQEALPVLWQVLAVNHITLRNEVRETIRTYGPYSKKDIEMLKQWGGLLGMEDPDKRRAVNPFVKAFFVVLLLGMEDLNPQEVDVQIDYLKLFEDADPRLRTFIADMLIDEPEKLSRRNRLLYFIPLLGDSSEGTSKKAREALDDMTWQFAQDVMYKEFKSAKQSTDVNKREVVDGKYIVTVRRSPVTVGRLPLVDKNGKQIFFDFGYRLAHETELTVWPIDGYVLTGKNSQEPKRVSTSKMLKVTEEDVETLMQILQDKSTPTDGLIYALDLLLSKGVGAQLRIAQLAPLLSEKAQGTNKDRNLAVIIRVLLLIISQKKPLDVGNEILSLCNHSQQNIRQLAIRCLPFIHDPKREFEKEILKTLYEALEDDNQEIRAKARETLEDCLQVREDRFVDEIRQSQTALSTARQADKRVMAAKALSHLGKKAEGASQALIAALDDKDIEVRTYAVQALGKIGAAAAANEGVKKIGELLRRDLDEDIANPTRDGSEKNAQLRRAALDALVSLKEHGRDAFPALGEYAIKMAVLEKKVDAKAAGIVQEHLLLALKAIGNIVQDPTVKCDNAFVISLVNLFQREVIEGNVTLAVSNLLELNNQKRAVVSSALIDTLRQMGPRALPGLRAYLLSKKKRASPTTDALPLMGAVEAVVAIFPAEGLVLDGELRKQLSTTLVELRDEHKASRRKFQGRDVEVFDRMLSRIEEAFRLVNKIPAPKN